MHKHTHTHTHIHKCHCTPYLLTPPSHLPSSLIHHLSPSSLLTSPFLHFHPIFSHPRHPLSHPLSSLLATPPSPLSLGEIAGIAMGVIGLCVLVVIFIFICGKYLFAFYLLCLCPCVMEMECTGDSIRLVLHAHNLHTYILCD